MKDYYKRSFELELLLSGHDWKYRKKRRPKLNEEFLNEAWKEKLLKKYDDLKAEFKITKLQQVKEYLLQGFSPLHTSKLTGIDLKTVNDYKYRLKKRKYAQRS